MDPQFREAHQRLWTAVVRLAEREYVAAPASLLAFTAWQSGDGSLANVALQRALDADPGYTMAQLIRDAIASGIPASAAQLPMTPEEVAASYGEAGGSAEREAPAWIAGPRPAAPAEGRPGRKRRSG
jgi:hypothetical protein